MNSLLGEGRAPRGSGASAEPRGRGMVRRCGELERGRASGLAPESGSGLPQSKAFGWLIRRGTCKEGGWQAHFVRRESCDAHSSPEPAARWFGEERVGRGLAGALCAQREL